ncbi:MAG: heavy metal translocating P-type ATPase [Clostridia bacterium]|nr:heavy metal translocating P-type ATPase [Clostridia bacterium]
MEQYQVTGMSCAACQARVEKAVMAVPGVTDCAVSLLTNSMGVEGTASPAAVVAAVEKAGYGAKLKGAEKSAKADPHDDILKDTETPKLVKRLIVSAVFLLILMYITMGHNMWGWPLPAYFEHNHLALTLTQMLLAIIVMVVNGRFFTSGFRSLIHGAPNMDTLVALGSSASFGWSLYVFYKLCGMVTAGAANMDLMEVYHNELYFESAAMIPALITVGKTLESLSKGRTTNALKSLIKLAPKRARLLRGDEEVEADVEDVRVGDVFVVRPGESIPVDGVVLEGESAVNESALTGESVPVDKAPGSAVSAATINTSGYLKCRAERVGEDTALSKIIKMVEGAAATKAPIARIADKVSGVFVPAVIGIALVVIAGWLIAGQSASFALARGISVLVISCPCALGLATPVAVMVGNGLGARNGILIKTGEALETVGKTDVVVLDKTGTITEGAPRVTDILTAEGTARGELLKKAYAIESRSEHPLAAAIVQEAEANGLDLPDTDGFRALPGNGLEGRVGGRVVSGGSRKYMESINAIDAGLFAAGDELASEGKTPLYFAEDGRLLGLIAVADVIKKSSPEAIASLKKLGLRVIMLTGDNERTARAIGRRAGVDEVIAGVLPDGKEAAVRALQKQGRVAMVGDGINDAPALTAAEIGIAIGAGTDVAIESADVVLMNSDLKDVAASVRLGRGTLRNIHENLFWAFFYNLICIPLAAGLFAWKMNPMIGAAAMSLSSVTVCLNALRLNLLDIKSGKHDRPVKARRRRAERALPAQAGAGAEAAANAQAAANAESKKTAVLRVAGMMCPHCEATVKKALEALDFVEEAEASHEAGTVKLTLGGEPDEAALKAAVEKSGYEYLGME